MEQLTAMLQEFVNKDYDEILHIAEEMLVRAVDVTKKYTNEDSAIMFVITFLSAALTSDGAFTKKEQQFIADLLGSEDQLNAILPKIDDDAYQKLNEIVDIMPVVDKSTLCMLAVCAVAVDETIEKSELGYLLNLLA